MMEKKTSFVDCEHRREEYCTNPSRKEKVNGIVLFYCLKSECTYDALKKWW